MAAASFGRITRLGSNERYRAVELDANVILERTRSNLEPALREAFRSGAKSRVLSPYCYAGFVDFTGLTPNNRAMARVSFLPTAPSKLIARRRRPGNSMPSR